ncbi:o-succinylbenzoate synthase [Kribbella solani]|uniref:o-succinylbenzoate synthase n=1 Tax=Kribbella solani TaxID=236067 RepID=UPI0029B3C760|nr:o-succinylbenzoate synthase [Kribbella solani]MDX2968112.1 o-succinylbenzoate synthase [Kribbella solani]MDX3004874.1 o-succinylbenzoate synthase [Kribbella solani]
MAKLIGVELVRVTMPLKQPFRTSFGSETARDILLLRWVRSDGEGWGECVAGRDPLYSSEYTDGAVNVIRRFLLPRLFADGDIRAESVAGVLEPISGHRMAKAAVEMAVLDAQLRSEERPFAEYLGSSRSRIPAGVSIGIQPSIGQLLDTVGGFLDEGYPRIKLKIEPGWDLEPVARVRERFGADVLLQVDANAAYRLSDARHLSGLDEFGLLLIEQPLANDDLRQHAELARLISTPICLDESIISAAAAADAIAMRAAQVINIKPGRVGGYLEARRIHDLAAAHGIAVWCGGMLETGLGRNANIALASLPGFTLPGDTSASDRFYANDITEPVVLRDGHVPVPTGPGLGAVPDEGRLKEFTVSREWIPAP